ncbi:MAG: DUF4391 domain-containing protein [Methanomicrobium sp.]|nr:DUF4391 domain-containing protein [Methanomicrobium sp.]
MFGLPKDYEKGIVTDKNRFPLSHLKPAERKRFRQSLRSLTLDSVVIDDIIPSYESETDSVKAVQFFSADVESIRSSSFISGILQRMIKTPCIIRFTDGREELYSFALKRLNLQDKNTIVVTDEFLTNPLSCGVSGEDDRLIQEFAGWDFVVNKTNLYSWYLEMMVKCYIITNRRMWSGMPGLLSSNVWYNSEDVFAMYGCVKHLVKLTEERRNSDTVGNSARLNSELKDIYDKLNGYFD